MIFSACPIMQCCVVAQMETLTGTLLLLWVGALAKITWVEAVVLTEVVTAVLAGTKSGLLRSRLTQRGGPLRDMGGMDSSNSVVIRPPSEPERQYASRQWSPLHR